MQKINTFWIHRNCFPWARLDPKTVFLRLIQNPVISSQNKDIVAQTPNESPQEMEREQGHALSQTGCPGLVRKQVSLQKQQAGDQKARVPVTVLSNPTPRPGLHLQNKRVGTVGPSGPSHVWSDTNDVNRSAISTESQIQGPSQAPQALYVYSSETEPQM